MNSIPQISDLKLSLIVAMDRNGLIGYQNHIPGEYQKTWHISGKDLKSYSNYGKNTWMSLGNTLDQRVNIVLTHDQNFFVPGAIVCHNVTECLEHCNLTKKSLLLVEVRYLNYFFHLSQKCI